MIANTTSSSISVNPLCCRTIGDYHSLYGIPFRPVPSLFENTSKTSAPSLGRSGPETGDRAECAAGSTTCAGLDLSGPALLRSAPAGSLDIPNPLDSAECALHRPPAYRRPGRFVSLSMQFSAPARAASAA